MTDSNNKTISANLLTWAMIAGLCERAVLPFRRIFAVAHKPQDATR